MHHPSLFVLNYKIHHLEFINDQWQIRSYPIELGINNHTFSELKIENGDKAELLIGFIENLMSEEEEEVRESILDKIDPWVEVGA
jgi:hypothetical protein